MARPRFRVAAPVDGLWRVNRVGSELLSRDYGPLAPGDTTAGNRYDSLNGSFRVSYLGTTLETCFGEVLAPLRPDPALAKLVVDDWHKLNCMEIGSIAADWRIRREAIRVVPSRNRRFFDVESLEALQILRTEIGPAAERLGHADIDVATVRGPDRRVTRLISEWVHAQTTPGGKLAFSGIRYRSRLNTDWECWAVFDHVHLRVVETRAVLDTMPELRSVAKQFHLKVF